MVKLRLLTLLLVLTLALAGCGTTPDSPTPTSGSGGSGSGGSGGLSGDIKIGAVWSLTGGAAVYGESQQNAANMALEEINASGMLGGAKLVLVTEDDRSEKDGAIAAFEKLINQDKVVAILGPTLSNSAKAADPIAQEKGIVVLAVSNTADGIVEMGNFIFRDSLPESAVIPNTVKQTQSALGYQKVAVLYGDDDAFTKAGYDVFVKALQENNIEVLTTETFKKGDTDFTAQLTKIKSTNPDAIIVSALAEEAANIMIQGRQLGIPETIPFIGGNGFNSPQLAAIAGPNAEGAISGAAWFVSADTPGNAEFVKAYTDKYGKAPDQFAAQAYTGVYLLAHAISQAGSTDPAAIRDALANIKDQPTVLGTFSFDESRNPVHEPVVQIVKDGKFALFEGNQ